MSMTVYWEEKEFEGVRILSIDKQNFAIMDEEIIQLTVFPIWSGL